VFGNKGSLFLELMAVVKNR